jgi:hypothetical protein
MDANKLFSITAENHKTIETNREFVAKWSAALSYVQKNQD